MTKSVSRSIPGVCLVYLEQCVPLQTIWHTRRNIHIDAVTATNRATAHLLRGRQDKLFPLQHTVYTCTHTHSGLWEMSLSPRRH